MSLMSSLYKLIAKVLANQLRKVMNKLVNKSRILYEGRQILDASPIANEVINAMLKRKENDIFCTVDIEKAYDKK